MLARIRFGYRSLAQAPLLSLVMVLSLGLGIGVNVAIFSLLHQVVLSSLPIPEPERLVLLTSPGDLKHGRSSDNNSGNMDYIFNWRTFRELEKHKDAAIVAGFRTFPSNVAFSRQTIAGSMMLVSGGYFGVLGVQPFVGRLIEPQDDVPGGGNPVAVLDYRYWRDKLGGAPDVLNQTVKVNGEPFTIVGVAAPNFTGTTVGDEPSVFVPISFKPRLTEGWNGTDKLADYWVYLIARLKPGISISQAQAALNGPYRSVVEEMAANIDGRTEKTPRFRQQKLALKNGSQGNSFLREEYRTALQILMLATALVLIIAMANAANLLLARAAERRKELAVRAALGAGRGDLVGQFLTEALLLASAGGIAGLAIASATLKLLTAAWGSDAHDSFATTGLDWPVLLFAVALSMLTGLLFGLYPAWDASRTTVSAALGEESAKSSGARGAATLRKALVCAQLTISVILLVPTGLLLRSIVNLLHVDLGIRTANIIGFRINPHLNGYSPAQSQALFARAEAELAAIPGARSVAASVVPLIAGNSWGTSFVVEGQPKEGQRPNSKLDAVSPGFFAQFGIALIAGRDFRESDTATAPKVVVVNETFVKQFLGGRNPIGVRLGFGKDYAIDTEIVGVVKDSHYAAVRQTPPAVFYRPWRQQEKLGELSFYVRSELPAAQIVPQIRAVMRSIDRDLPVEDVRTMDEQVHFNIRRDELTMRLAASFAALAVALAMLGLYGVMAHGVARRTREIGIRMALGAAPKRIRSMVMGETAWIASIGLGIGIPIAMASTRVVESRLYGVKGRDAAVIACAVILLGLTAAIAAFLPARRASRVSPLDALRHE